MVANSRLEEEMKKTVFTAPVMLLFAVAIAVTIPAGTAALTAGDVSGTWTITVKGSPHGDMSGTLTLQQDGTKVTGTMAAHGGEHTVSGEFENGTLKLTIERTSEEETTLTGKFKEDGSLAGYVSGPMGDMQWTATRAKDK
jgi:hypothetical protein